LSEYNKDRTSVADIEMSSWMRHISEETKIKDMTIPGTHNAGAYMTKNFIIGVKDFVVC